MDEHSRQYLEAMESLFMHPGWQLFMDDVQGWQDAISQQWQSVTPEQLRFEQGRFKALGQVTGHQKMLEQVKEALLQATPQGEDA